MSPERLDPLFDPRSIAVVGASADASKWGGDMAARLIAREHTRAVYLVNSNGGEMHGRVAYPSLLEVPGTPDLVVLAMPATGLEAALDDALAAGARGIIAVFAGLGETGPDGKERERAAVARVRAAGAAMVGPNCMGLADTSTGLQAAAYLDIPAGGIGLVSQSGGIGEELVTRARESGVGFSRYVTVGNQADVGVAEILRGLVGHEPTKVVGVYVEDLRDGREFARAARDVVASGRPVVVLAPGRSEASTRSAMTHTGSLAPDAAVSDALCGAAGVVRVATPGQLFEALFCLLSGRRTRGRGIAVVSDGGGHGGLAADAVVAAGLGVNPLSEATLARVREVLPVSVGDNPIDFALGTINPDAYGSVVEALTGADDVDAVLAAGQFGYWQARFSRFEDKIAEEMWSASAMAAAAERTGTPVIVCSSYPGSRAAGALRERGVPVYREIDAAVGSLSRIVEATENEARVGARTARGVESISAIPPAASRGLSVAADDYWGARQALVDYGLPFVPAGLARDEAEARGVAGSVGYPVVLKALGLLHKSDRGGVVVGLANQAELTAAFEDMARRLAPPGYCVEQMARTDDGVELIVGCRWDAHAGPVVVVGLGGIYTELLGDVRIALAPTDESTVEGLLRSLRGASLLYGIRGRPPVDVPAACRAAVAIAGLAAAHPEVASLEVNPLLVTPDGVLCLDARIVTAASATVAERGEHPGGGVR